MFRLIMLTQAEGRVTRVPQSGGRGVPTQSVRNE
jgi:hypothetical protein